MAARFVFPRGAVATPHYLASAVGAATLERGGNAIDAIIAANLALGVVAPYFCGYGGDLFAIVWDGALTGYLGSGRSPSGTSADAVRSRSVNGQMPVFGPDSVTVPGAVAGWFDLLERWGTRSFGDLAQDAIRLARDGFEVTPGGAIAIGEARRMYRDFPSWQATYGDAIEGSVLRQPALARTIELLASDGPDAYYRGPIADDIAATLQALGGDLATSDLAAHAGEWTDPMLASYRDVQVAELPPPTQGVTPLEALRILDGLDLPAPGVDREHLLIEALKQALADRDQWVTDPAHMPHPASALLEDGWVSARRAAIDPREPSSRNAGVPTRRWHRVSVCRRCRRAAREPHPVELRALRLRCARERAGDQPQQSGLLVLTRREPTQCVCAVEATDAHAHPGDGPSRWATSPRVREHGRRRASGRAHPGARAHRRRGHAPSRRDCGTALADRRGVMASARRGSI